LDEKLTRAICIRFSIPTKKIKIIKRRVKLADKKAAWLEAIHLAGFSKQEADRIFGKHEGIKGYENSLLPQPPFFIRKKFVNRFNDLY